MILSGFSSLFSTLSYFYIIPYRKKNVLFKISFPAEFHAQTAVEAAVTLHPQIKDRLDEIANIEVTTHESAKFWRSIKQNA